MAIFEKPLKKWYLQKRKVQKWPFFAKMAIFKTEKPEGSEPPFLNTLK